MNPCQMGGTKLVGDGGLAKTPTTLPQMVTFLKRDATLGTSIAITPMVACRGSHRSPAPRSRVRFVPRKDLIGESTNK